MRLSLLGLCASCLGSLAFVQSVNDDYNALNHGKYNKYSKRAVDEQSCNPEQQELVQNSLRLSDALLTVTKDRLRNLSQWLEYDDAANLKWQQTVRVMSTFRTWSSIMERGMPVKGSKASRASSINRLRKVASSVELLSERIQAPSVHASIYCHAKWLKRRDSRGKRPPRPGLLWDSRTSLGDGTPLTPTWVAKNKVYEKNGATLFASLEDMPGPVSSLVILNGEKFSKWNETNNGKHSYSTVRNRKRKFDKFVARKRELWSLVEDQLPAVLIAALSQSDVMMPEGQSSREIPCNSKEKTQWECVVDLAERPDEAVTSTWNLVS